MAFKDIYYIMQQYLLASMYLCQGILILAASQADNYAVERRFFKLSLLYLFLHFGAILAEAGLARFGLGGW